MYKRNPTHRVDQSVSTEATPAAIPDSLVNFDLLPNTALVRLPVVCGLYACSPATTWRRVKSGLIPQPVKLGGRITAWRVGDLRQALAS